MGEQPNIADAVAILEAHDDYRLLRRIKSATTWGLPGVRTAYRHGLFVDVETTGLNLDSDEIIEVALLPFEYDPETGQVLAVHEDQALDQFRDPGIPIPPESAQVHGITDEMVRGQVVDGPRLTVLVAEADLIIAHNAAFDRPMLERLWPCFAEKPWACSFADVDWRAEGFGAGKLDYLLMQQGWFFDGHRALTDCLAGAFLLNLELPVSRRRALHALLESARKGRYLIRAVGSPFDAKDDLRKRGYRWDPGTDTREKTWWILVEDSESELAWLKEQVYRRDIQLPVRPIDARDRFSGRVLEV